MTILHELTPNALLTLRRQGGVATSGELQAALGVSQPTVSRALAPLIQSGQVQKVGAARSQRYLLPRTVAGVGKVSMDQVTRGVWPFMVAQFLLMFLMVAFPQLVMVPARWFSG